MRRSTAVALGIVAAALAAWALWPRKPLSDEALIRLAIDDMAHKAAARDISGVVEHVSERYRGEGGDKADLKRYLLGYILRSEWVAAFPAKVEVTLDGPRADVTFVVLLARASAAKSAEEIPAESLVGSHRIEARLEKEGDDWRVVSATRRDATPADWLR